MTFGKIIGGIGLALGLALATAGCETLEPPPSAAEDASTNLYFSGKSINAVEIDELRRDLGEHIGANLLDEKGRMDVSTLLDRMDKGEISKAAVQSTYKGIGGFYTRLLTRTAVTLNSTAQYPKFSGKIRRYVYNRYAGSGYLEVDTRLETLRNGVVTRTDFWWSIAVLPGTYEVFQRVEDQLDDPFPDAPIGVPEEALDPENEFGIWKRNLNHKLFAQGDGIVVLAVTRDGILLPDGDPVYQSDADSCIDILFEGPPPEQTLPQQSAYCLGRCAHPMIVNTGM